MESAHTIGDTKRKESEGCDTEEASLGSDKSNRRDERMERYEVQSSYKAGAGPAADQYRHWDCGAALNGNHTRRHKDDVGRVGLSLTAARARGREKSEENWKEKKQKGAAQQMRAQSQRMRERSGSR